MKWIVTLMIVVLLFYFSWEKIKSKCPCLKQSDPPQISNSKSAEQTTTKNLQASTKVLQATILAQLQQSEDSLLFNQLKLFQNEMCC